MQRNWNSAEEQLDRVEKTKLKDILSKFYAGCRTEKGELYKVNSLNAIRSGLQRYFLEIGNFDIINDEYFRESNVCFQNILAVVKSSGKGQIDHYPEVEPEDLNLLYSSFDIDSPTGLMEKVWLDIMVFFIRRGRENLRAMTKTTFSISADASGK